MAASLALVSAGLFAFRDMSQRAQQTEQDRPSLWRRVRYRAGRARWWLRNRPHWLREVLGAWVRRVDWTEVVRDAHLYGGLGLATWAGHQVGGPWAFVALGVVLAWLGARGVSR